MAIGITFKWVGGATWILKSGGLKIGCDPVLCPLGTVQDYFWFKTKRREEPEYEAIDFKDVDLWLVTHGHEDHLDDAGLDIIGKGSAVVAHKNAVAKLKRAGLNNVTELAWGEEEELTSKGFEITVEAIPAVHGVNPIVAYLAGGVNGYWLTLKKSGESVSIYIPSDTVIKKKVIDSLRGRRCDLLIPNLGAARIGSGVRGRLLMDLTLSARKVGRIIEVVSPRVTIPVHFGTFTHYTEQVDEIRAFVEGVSGDGVKMLEPGESITLEL